MPPDASLLTSPEGAFATGFSRYSDTHPEIKELLPRIYVQFQLAGATSVYLALLDTGGHYCVLSPEVRDAVEDGFVDGFGSAELLTARGLLRGELYRHRIDFIVEEGETVGVEAIVLVSPDWYGPTIIGYTGVIDRMRSALDPGRNRFYVGPLI